MLLDPDDPLSELLTIPAAARQIGRPAATVRDWIRKGWLSPLRIPGRRNTWTTARDVRECEAEIFRRNLTP